MPGQVLAILEVSQKQAYIFSSNKVRDNIVNSAVIAYIMSVPYLEKAVADAEIFNKEDNYVYAGGGHTVLQFDTMEKARACMQAVTRHVHENYPDVELFVKLLDCNSEELRDLPPGKKLQALTKALEEKKTFRTSSFGLSSYGVERLDANTLRPERVLTEEQKANKAAPPEPEQALEKTLMPEGYQPTYQFERLGGSKDDKNYLAIVHIDGNGMGKRVANFYQENMGLEWDAFRNAVGTFSQEIDDLYKNAYRRMNDAVAARLADGSFADLDLKKDNFPVRRIITSGDDICFVSDGRIGLYCAAEFIRQLLEVSGHRFTASAGVAIVHQKYPFFKAYELAESLCGNAKTYSARLAEGTTYEGSDVCAIDWHVEQGEIRDSLEDVRSAYRTRDGGYLELRPYILEAPQELLEKDPHRRFEVFCKVLQIVQAKGVESVRSKMKELRAELKKGEAAADFFIHFHKMDDIILRAYGDIYESLDMSKLFTGQKQDRKFFVETFDAKKCSTLYDAVEIMDTCIIPQIGG